MTAGEIAEPAVAFVGCSTKTSCVADAALIVNAELTAEASPVLEAVIFFEPERLMLRSLKVAKPPEFVTCVSVPLRVPVPVVNASVIETPELVTSLPDASLSCTVTAGEIVCPAVVLVGC